jgi:hypothetical protein
VNFLAAGWSWVQIDVDTTARDVDHRIGAQQPFKLARQ